MSVLLNHIGAVIIGGLVFLSVIGFYLNLNDNAASQNAAAIVESNVHSASEIFESDLRQAGFRVEDSVKVTRADSNQIIFRTDIDNDGVADSIKYYLGSTRSPNSANPRTRVLYRVVNNQAPRSIDAGVTGFRLWYYDAKGAVPTHPSKVRAIRALIAMQTTLSDDSVNAGAVWEKMIHPKNLR